MNKVSLTDLDINEINIIIAGLMELPARVSMPLYNKIKSQVESQFPASNDGSTAVTGKDLPWKNN